MATTFGDFKNAVVSIGRGASSKTEFVVKDAIKMNVNKMDIRLVLHIFLA